MEPRTNTVILSVLSLCTSSLCAMAEDITKITVEQSGVSEVFYVRESGKLYFSDSSLIIDELGDGNSVSKKLASIDKLQFVQDNTSGTDSKSSASVCVYPNPASDFIALQNGDNEPALYEIYNTQGEIIMSGSTSCSELINISHLPCGLYTLKSNNNVFKFCKI
ncbi:MAG: T9SS type A sorting domain-containing protein [Paludibacteraceae bacterium]|nr:T9SS type A sorting domain-containing protein [Paludibacteraceae bacterium]